MHMAWRYSLKKLFVHKTHKKKTVNVFPLPQADMLGVKPVVKITSQSIN